MLVWLVLYDDNCHVCVSDNMVQVGCMSRLVSAAVTKGCDQVIQDVRRLLGNVEGEELPKTPEELTK